MDQEIFELIKPFLTTSPLAFIVYFLYRSGILNSFAHRLKKNGDDRRLTDLQEWRELAENNHFRDLDSLIKDMEELSRLVNKIDKRLIVVETRQNNGRNFNNK